jgi:hypothetical protein
MAQGWGDWGGTPAPARSSGGGNSRLWPDFLSNNPISETAGHWGDWASHNPVTSVAARFVTGPHQLVDFATHDWIAGLWGLGHLAAHDVTTPGVWLEDPRKYLRDPHTLGGGFVTPLVKGYNQKYQIENILGDELHGRWGAAVSDYRKQFHNEAQDPFGTLLDLTVAGKALDTAHLASLQRAAAAGKIPEGSLRARLYGRVGDESPRDFLVRPGKDLLGNEYEGAKGTLITKSFRSRGTVGRMIQSYVDEMRLRLPEGVPFSAHNLSAKEIMRQVHQVFQRNSYHINQAAHLISQLPEGLQYAIQHVAELPRDLVTVGGDPIGHMLEFYKQQRTKVAALDDNYLNKMRVKALDHRIEVMSRVNDVKEAIYDPAHPDHAQFREAYDAAREADQIVRRELVRRGLIKQSKLDALDVLVHRVLRGVRYDVGHPQEDVLGSYTGPGAETAASPHGPAVVHRYPLPADPIHTGRIAALIDRRTGEVHIAEPSGALSAEGVSASAPTAAWHADLADAAGIRSLGDLKDHFIQASTGDAVPSLDIPRRWILPSDVPRDELGRIVDHLQQIENLPVETGDFEGMIPARAEATIAGGQTTEQAAEQQQAALESHAQGGADHNPLAQYGPSWHWPHEAFATVGAPTGLAHRVADFVLHHNEPRSRAVSEVVAGMTERPGDAWLEGLINANPDALNTATFHRWSEIRAQDFMDRYLYPMSGQLRSGLGYENGGKLTNETFILKPRHLIDNPIKSDKIHFATIGDVIKADSRLRQITEGPRKESTAQWIQRLNDAGLRRVKTKYVTRWERETKTARTIFQRIVHGGINQIWRYLLLAVKPGWAIANAETNQFLVLLKNTGRGGIRAFLSMVKDSMGHSRLRKLAEYTKRMDFSPEAKAEVQQMIGESMGEGVHRLEPALGSAQWSESTLFRPTRAGREVRVDAVTPQGRFLTNLARHPGYSARRVGHMLGAPARFVEKINRASEGFARRQAYVAKTYQMTGKMAHNMPELEKILREGKIKGNEEKMQELLMGPNGPMDALGDYGRMSAREREYVTAVIPFYAWYKTILGISAKFFIRDTGRVWILHAIATGLAQTAAQDMQLGVPVPSFAKDLIPVFGPKGDEQLAMSTHTWNPFQTPVDIGRNIEAFATADPSKATPNEVGLGLFGPAVQAAYTAVTGKEPFYGGNYRGWGSGQGRPGAVLGSFLYGLPQKRLYDQLTGGYKSKVYQAPPGQSPVPGLSNAGYVGLLQYLGVPVRYVNLPTLQTRAIEEGAKPTRAPAQQNRGGWGDWGGG